MFIPPFLAFLLISRILRIFRVSLYIPRFSCIPRSSVYPAFLRIFRVSVSPFHHFIIFMISSLNHSIISSFHVSSSFHRFIILWWFLRSVVPSFHRFIIIYDVYIDFIVFSFHLFSFIVRNAHDTLVTSTSNQSFLYTSTSAALASFHRFIILWWFHRSVVSSFHHYLWWLHRFIFHRFIISPFFFVHNAHDTLVTSIRNQSSLYFNFSRACSSSFSSSEVMTFQPEIRCPLALHAILNASSRFCLAFTKHCIPAVCRQIPSRIRHPDTLFSKRMVTANATRRQRLDPLKRAESTHIKEFIRPASDVYRDEVLFAVPGNLTSSCCGALEAQLSAFSNFPDVIFSPHASSPYHFWVYMHPQGLNLLRLGGGVNVWIIITSHCLWAFFLPPKLCFHLYHPSCNILLSIQTNIIMFLK
jgi:hypothetical protein